MPAMRGHLSICVVAVAALVARMPLLAQTAGTAGIETALLGTWNLDLARSTFNSSVPFYGGTPPASRTMRFDSVAGGIRHVIDTSTTELVERYRVEYTFKIDGRDYQAPSTMPIDTMTFRRIDGSTIERVGKMRDGRVAHVVTYHVSADGKTLTATERGTNRDAAGNEIVVSSVQVFVRQST